MNVCLTSLAIDTHVVTPIITSAYAKSSANATGSSASYLKTIRCGKTMRTSISPLLVPTPVAATTAHRAASSASSASAPASSPALPPPSVACAPGSICSTAVPARMVCCAWRRASYAVSAGSVAVCSPRLRTGMLSPVRLDSSTMAAPRSSTRSAGATHLPPSTATTSPGTSSVECTRTHAPPPRRTVHVELALASVATRACALRVR